MTVFQIFQVTEEGELSDSYMYSDDKTFNCKLKEKLSLKCAQYTNTHICL